MDSSTCHRFLNWIVLHFLGKVPGDAWFPSSFTWCLSGIKCCFMFRIKNRTTTTVAQTTLIQLISSTF
ncbi:hypothetical protein ECANGB1_2663 [Enterospora canceri]|uniref:Uncharacterized protein n=1 Tax=Enterospora canceri TaxID=1081671 RepID=A0A1Y1S5T3_9MICR|nr:hypothetical protein ECANGB1_2663 [Enterospora canceri]